MAQHLARDDAAERSALEQALIRLAELHERRGETGAATDRWTMVVGLCAQVPNPTATLIATIAHAQTFVAERWRALAAAVDANLAPALGQPANATAGAGRRQST